MMVQQQCRIFIIFLGCANPSFCDCSMLMVCNFLCRNGLTVDSKKMSFAEMMTDDAQTSREERCFRLWINSLGVATYVNNVFEDVRNG